MPLSRLVFLALPIIASLSVTAVIAGELEGSIAPAPSSAEEAFARYCAACHGNDGRGGLVVGLSKPAPDLTRLTVRNGGTFPREQLARIVDGRRAIAAHGSREMPVWGDWFKLEGEEAYEGPTEEEAKIRRRIEDLLDLVQSMQRVLSSLSRRCALYMPSSVALPSMDYRNKFLRPCPLLIVKSSRGYPMALTYQWRSRAQPETDMWTAAMEGVHFVAMHPLRRKFSSNFVPRRRLLTSPR